MTKRERRTRRAWVVARIADVWPDAEKGKVRLDPPRLGMWSADGAEDHPTRAEMARDLGAERVTKRKRNAT